MLLSCQNHTLYLPYSSIHSSNNSKPNTIINCQNPNDIPIPRRHNSKSTSFLIHHLSRKTSDTHHHPSPTELQDPTPHEEKVKLLELSLVRKRTPQFPGSIYAQSPTDADVGSSLPPLRTLFRSSDEEEEEVMIMKAIDIRRKVTQEVFKEAMKKGKFGITYTENMVSRLGSFIDYVMIEAANLKRLPQYSHSTFNLRAKTVIEDSQVVQLIRWLKHNALSYPQIAKLVLMSRGKLESIRNRIEWLKSVRVKGDFIGDALLKGGDNILLRSDQELDEIVECLESNGVRREWMGYVVSRCPKLLSYSLEEVKIRVQFYLDMGLDDKDFGTMVFDFPNILSYYTLEEMNRKVDYLKEFGIDSKGVGKLLAFRPQLMACSIEERWKPLVKYLYYYGITRDGMKRMLTIKPMVFCADLEMTIVPKVKFFQDLGVRNDAIAICFASQLDRLPSCSYSFKTPHATVMENHNLSEVLGSRGLIQKQEFLRIILQSLYSLGYTKSASCLELESGVSFKSNEFQLLESHVLNGNWDDCAAFLDSIRDILGESVDPALFLVFRQCLMEYLKKGELTLALDVLRKRVSALRVDRCKIHGLATNALLGVVDDGDVGCDLRGRLLTDLENMLPPPICLPAGRLEHLVETTLTAWVDSCLFHTSANPVSLYEDHRCGREHFPTTTTQILTGHKNEVWFVQFSNNGDYLASSSNDCTAIIWKVQENGKLTLKHTLCGHLRAVSFVAWSPDDTKLLTCGNIEVLKLWDVETGTCKHTFGTDGFVVSSCAWFPNSNQFVCGSFDPEKGICMWDCDGNELRAWRGMRMPKVVDLTVTPDGEYLISIFLDKEIRILHLGTNAERVISEKHPITSISVSGDGKFFIVNLNSQEIHMWDVAGTWKKPMKYTGHKQCKYVIRSCFGGLNSTFIASGSENSEVYIWNTRSSKPIEVLSGHTLTVNCVSWNPKRPQMLASASDDHTIRIWGPSL